MDFLRRQNPVQYIHPLQHWKNVLASFPGSHAREREIEIVQAIYIRVPGEPGNEAKNVLISAFIASYPGY